MADLVEAVLTDIRRRRLFARGERIVVAVSGGLDSMVLLRVLSELAPDRGWSLVAAHFNHGLRGRASDRDEAFVLAAAKRLGWPCACGRADPPLRARARGVSLEMAAREARHRFLADAAARWRASKVALGHHADDQVETVLLRLLRGTGAEGLAGIRWSSPSPADPEIGLARPLLAQTRLALRAFARRRRLAWREDRTNARVDATRNWLRREIVPRLQRRFGAALTSVVGRAADLVGAEAEAVSEWARTWRLARRRAGFATLPRAVQRRLIVRQLIEHGVEPDFELVEALRSASDEPRSIGPSRRVWRDQQGELRVDALLPPGFAAERAPCELRGGAGRTTFSGVTLAWRRVRRPGSTRVAPRPHREWFDADRVGTRIVLRHWQRGDRFQPIGCRTAVKLQDLFVNAKVGRDERHRRVVAVAENGDIFWVEGLRMAERFKVTLRTRLWLEWSWGRAPGHAGQGTTRHG